MSKELRIIFLGTPDFAAESLKKLVESGVLIVAVVTAPDKPKGRGKKLAISAVKEFALEAGLSILQPTNLKSPEFQAELNSFKADLQIVVAFRMLPESVWNMPKLGTFNLHASLLPQYRGAAPINWAIINGEKETGVSTFFLKHEIDTGAIIYQEKEPIHDSDNVGTLYARLMKKGAELVLKTVLSIQEGNYPQLEQNESEEIRPAPKIFKDDCFIDWNQPAVKVKDFIRGLSPYPAAWTKLEGKTLKIYSSKLSEASLSPGEGMLRNNELIIGTAENSLIIEELQLEGKKRMKTSDFIRGFQFKTSDKIYFGN